MFLTLGGRTELSRFFWLTYVFIYRYIHSFKSRVRIQKDIMISLLMGEEFWSSANK